MESKAALAAALAATIAATKGVMRDAEEKELRRQREKPAFRSYSNGIEVTPEWVKGAWS